jgi:hypothetical protein
MAKLKTPRWGWALTGSGHFFKECLRMAGDLDDVDLFVSKAAGEVVRMYRQEFKLPANARFSRHHGQRRPVGQFITACTITLIFLARITPRWQNVFGISIRLSPTSLRKRKNAACRQSFLLAIPRRSSRRKRLRNGQSLSALRSREHRSPERIGEDGSRHP